MKYPYSDEFMTYDKLTHRYTLTEKDVLDNLGINLSERVNSQTAIGNLLRMASLHVYSFIHKHNIANDGQDYVIAKTETGRKIIKEAMERQLTYILVVGDLTMSVDPTKSALWFDELAKEVLMQSIPEIRTSICYTGRFPQKPIYDTEW